MTNRSDLFGRRFGMLTAIRFVGDRKWSCVCDCGNTVIVASRHLVGAKTKSCGCYRKQFGRDKLKSLIGKRFGRLTVIGQSPRSNGERIKWVCHCDCGREIIATGANLQSGNTKSCRCLNDDSLKERSTIHGMHRTVEYKAWCHIKERCYNRRCKDWKNYGARGITVCDEWLNSFEQFYRDMGQKPSPNLTIERINNDEGYSADNCIWATRLAQRHNRRDSNKRSAKVVSG